MAGTSDTKPHPAALPFPAPDARLRITFGSVELRQFRAEDAEDLHRIRNHESVRGFLADPRPIAYESHVQWVNRNLVPAREILLFIARSGETPIGFALLKRLAPDTVEIGVMFRDARRHPLIPSQSAAIMAFLAFDYYGFPWGVTYAQKEHVRALALNRGLGGREVESDKPGEICFRQQGALVLRNWHYLRLMARIGPKMTLVTE